MNKKYPNRKRIRLKGYDYTTPGYYFITIKVKERAEDLCKIENGKMILNESGKIMETVWKELPQHYPNCKLDEYVIMPDHFHGIIQIIKRREGSVTLPKKNEHRNKTNNERTIENKKPNIPIHGLPEIIRGFKTFSSKQINEKIKSGNKFEWQKSYYDRIIRTERELENVRKYIINNPVNLKNENDKRK